MSCLHPITIRPQNIKFEPDKMSIYSYQRIYNKTYKPYYEVPCGKCINCLRRIQSDYSVLVYRSARRLGNVAFVTLTYAPDKLPFRATVVEYGPDGIFDQVYPFDEPKDCCGKDSVQVYIREYLSKHPKQVDNEPMDCVDIKHDPITGNLSTLTITPSLRRLDVRMWLKKSRIYYKREFGHNLPDFKYMCVGEYGFHTHRPHYHLLFFGLKRPDLMYLLKRWRNDFGFYRLDMVKNVVTESKNSYEAVANYIAKYINKGEFEWFAVEQKFVEKPRKMSSKDLGDISYDLEAMRRYHLCFDLFGEYDVNNVPEHLKNNPLFYEEINKRKQLSIGKKSYVLPRYAARKIFGSKSSHRSLVDSSKVVVSYGRSELQKLLGDYARAKYQRETDAQFERYKAAFPDLSDSVLILMFESSQRNSARALADCRREKLKSFYFKSKF